MQGLCWQLLIAAGCCAALGPDWEGTSIHNPDFLAWQFRSDRAAGQREKTSQDWNTPEVSSRELPFDSARQLLEFLGIASSDFGDLADQVGWQEHENKLLRKLLYHLHVHLDWWDLERVSVKYGCWEELLANFERFRGEIVTVEGAVEKTEVVELPPEEASRLGFSRFYRVRLKATSPSNGEQPEPEAFFEIFTLDVPRVWVEKDGFGEPAGALVLLLKKGPEEESGPCIFAAAKRVAWYPNSLLGRLKMDVGLFDLLDRRVSQDLSREPRTPPKIARFRLGVHNRECFYQLLAAVGRAGPGTLFEEAKRQLAQEGVPLTSVVPLFNEPEKNRGRLVLLRGTAREVLRVDVPDRDVRARFGISHYYQIHLFTDDSQGNPLVICVRELPPRMPVGTGPTYAETVTVAGFFFNTWAYRRQLDLGSDQKEAVWQLAPLIIGREVIWHPREAPSPGPWIPLIAAGIFLVLLVAIWWGMLQTFRGRPPILKDEVVGQ